MGKRTIELVQEFHEKFGHPVAKKVGEGLAAELRALRVRLIAEELAELCHAWGVQLHCVVNDEKDDTQDEISVWANPEAAVNHSEGADALGDLDYVIQGANLVAGYPAQAVVEEIHRSNMSKLGADGKPVVREDGKILKGPDYFKPDIGRILEEAAGAA